MNYAKLIYLILVPLILLIPAFYNAYPLVYSDSGTYIQSGFDLFIPQDRPVFYGLFIRFFSLGFSLWLVVYIQAAIVSYILWHLTKTVLKNSSLNLFVLILLPLSWFSGLGWYTSQIMPDIFTFTALGAMLLLALPSRLSQSQQIIIAIILVLSINVHFSNIVITSLTLLCLFLFFRKKFNLTFSIPILVLVLSLGISSLSNFIIGKTFSVSQGSHVFLMGKMLDSGILKSYLDEHCPDKNYSLCAYKEALPSDSRAFLWDTNSPLYKDGGWKGSKTTYRTLLWDIFTSPKYLFFYGYNSATSTIAQLFQNEVGSGLVSTWYKTKDSPPYVQISKHFGIEFNQYIQSRQNVNLWHQGLEQTLTYINGVYRILLCIATFLLFLIFLSKSLLKTIASPIKLMAITFMIGLFWNALIVASLANIYDRLQARISWIIIFCLCLIILHNGKELYHSLIRITIDFFNKQKTD